MALLGEEGEEPCVDIASPRSHDQALRGCHPHRGVDREAALDATHRGAATEMQEDEVWLGFREELGSLRSDVGVRRAMEAVPADALVVEGGGNSVAEGRGRQGRVEGGIEHPNMWNVRKDLEGSLDALDRGRIVQRGEGGVAVDREDDGGGDNSRCREFAATTTSERAAASVNTTVT